MDAFGASRSCTTSFSSPTPNWSRYYYYARITTFRPRAESPFSPRAKSPCFDHMLNPLCWISVFLRVLNLRVSPRAESQCFPTCWFSVFRPHAKCPYFPTSWISTFRPRAESLNFPTCWISLFHPFLNLRVSPCGESLCSSRANSPCFLTSWISLFPHVLNLRVSPHAESSSFSPRVESPDALNHIFL